MLDRTRFGEYGGQYVPEILMPALIQLETVYDQAKNDKAFLEELRWYNVNYGGRETPLYFAKRLTEKYGGAKIYLKREDLAHGGAHKFNNVMGQALLAKRMGKTRIIAETGAGQHGTATAMAAAVLGMEAEIYMGAEDVKRQRMNVFRMRLMGAKVNEVEIGSKTLKDAISEAFRDWAASVETTYYMFGTAAGPHPYPTLVRDFQSIIGKEIKTQTEGTGRQTAGPVGGMRRRRQQRHRHVLSFHPEQGSEVPGGRGGRMRDRDGKAFVLDQRRLGGRLPGLQVLPAPGQGRDGP